MVGSYIHISGCISSNVFTDIAKQYNWQKVYNNQITKQYIIIYSYWLYYAI